MRFCSTIPSIGSGETPQIGTIKEINGNRSSEINKLSSLASLAFRLLTLALLLVSSAHRAPCRGNAAETVVARRRRQRLIAVETGSDSHCPQ